MLVDYGITVCVGDDYVELLQKIAPRWIASCQKIIVVTDEASADRVRAIVGPDSTFVTDAFTRHGARFNKYSAVNEALKANPPQGWIISFDSDIQLPEDFALHVPSVRKGLLYCARRYGDKAQELVPNHRRPAGYFLMFHSDDPVLGPMPWFKDCYTHGGCADTDFVNARWSREKWRWFGMKLRHYGDADNKWFGPKTTPDEMKDLLRKGELYNPKYRVNPNKHPIPFSMKAPRDPRPGIWRDGVLQIKITNACDLDCKNCSVGVGLARKLKRVFHMTPDQFRTAVRSLRGYFGVIGMFGGNPCIHPHFEELCAIFREEVPDINQRGLWSNRLFGKGAICRRTFSPRHSNLNVHGSQEAYNEIRRDWPEARILAEGLHSESMHSPVLRAIKDFIPDEKERWDLIGKCYVNQKWSAAITLVSDQLLAYFCEIAATHAELYDDPARGMAVVPDWWKKGITEFESQIRHYCHNCGLAFNGHRVADRSEAPEDYTDTHASLMLTIKGRPLRHITTRTEAEGDASPVIKYLPAGVLPAGIK